MIDGLMMGLGFTLALVLLGAAREILGSGTLFADASLLLGNWAAFLELRLINDYKGFLLVILPPGGFIVLSFLLAGKRLVDRSLAARRAARDAATDAAPGEAS
jgi:Na+-translocating ferredoxin:NAD+ oxidoreductase subunit E